MISVNSIASGSTGNAYLVSDGSTALLIECGISLKRIQQAMGFSTSSLSGVLVSHEHRDHSHCALAMAKAGVDIYTSAGTAAAIGLSGHRLNIVKKMKKVVIGTWTVLPFEVQHDAAEPLGFFLASGKSRLLFLTDTAFCRFLFKGVTHLMIEANYSDEIIDQAVYGGTLSKWRHKRLVGSHFSIERVVEFLGAMDRSCLQEVWLLHLSSSNSNEEEFKQTVQGITGVPVHVC